MEGVLSHSVDEENRTLEIKCTEDVFVHQIARRFAHLLNNRSDGRVYASKYLVSSEGSDTAEITYAGRKQAFVMREKDSIYIVDDHKGVGIEDILSEYERLCEKLGLRSIEA